MIVEACCITKELRFYQIYFVAAETVVDDVVVENFL